MPPQSTSTLGASAIRRFIQFARNYGEFIHDRTFPLDVRAEAPDRAAQVDLAGVMCDRRPDHADQVEFLQ